MIETWENRYANSMQEAMQAEIDELRAELAALKQQAPVAKVTALSPMDFIAKLEYSPILNGNPPFDIGTPLYLAPGAQPVPTV